MSLELFRKFMRDFFSQTLGNERPTRNKCTRFLRTLITVRENSCSLKRALGDGGRCIFCKMQNTFTRHASRQRMPPHYFLFPTVLVIKYHASY